MRNISHSNTNQNVSNIRLQKYGQKYITFSLLSKIEILLWATIICMLMNIMLDACWHEFGYILASN